MEAPDLPHVDERGPGSACRVIPPHLGMPLLAAVGATCKLIMGTCIIMNKWVHTPVINTVLFRVTPLTPSSASGRGAISVHSPDLNTSVLSSK